MGSTNKMRMGPAKKMPLLRKPKAAIVPNTVAKAVVALPMIRLFTMERRHESAVNSS